MSTLTETIWSDKHGSRWRIIEALPNGRYILRSIDLSNQKTLRVKSTTLLKSYKRLT